MKDTRPIEAQVAELTDEQKRTIPKIYKYHLIFSIVLIVALLAGLLIAHVGVVNAQSDYDEIQAKISASPVGYLQYGAESRAAFDALDAAVNVRTMFAIIGGIVTILLACGAQLLISKKYPYYSEKKYTYLKKSARQG